MLNILGIREKTELEANQGVWARVQEAIAVFSDKDKLAASSKEL